MYSLYLLLCVCCIGLNAAKISKKSLQHTLENPCGQFEQFIQEYGKQYANEKEKLERFKIFLDNLKGAMIKNEKSTHAEFGITKFMDLTVEEFKKRYNGLIILEDRRFKNPHCVMLSDDDIQDVDAPESWDWRDYGVVTPVKSQENGDSYAFGSTGNIESQYAIKHRELPILSEQQIVDCDSRIIHDHGGKMTYAFSTIMDIGGIQSENNYPYTGVEEYCSFDVNRVKVKLSGCNDFNLKSQEKLKQLVYTTGPIAVAVYSREFMHYKGGIISDEDCGTDYSDHSVLLVGYGEENGKPYWLIKNSWGTDFGEDGYIRIARGDNNTSCMIMNDMMANAIVE